jgi:hypothetical protein
MIRPISKENHMAPSIRQMRARMNSGHLQVLEALRDGRKLTAGRMSDARGLMTCRDTLVKWGAIDGEALTDIGRELLGEKVAA